MPDKEMYEYFQYRLEEGLQEKEVRRLSDEWLNEIVQCYLRGHYKQVQENLEKGKRFQRLLKKAVSDPISYVIGIFSGVLYAMVLLTGVTRQRMDFFQDAATLFKKAHVEAIAEYLYRHPNTQHKTLCAELKLNKGYLSQLLRDMERTGCVERYAAGRMSFYSLTLYGQEFIKKERFRKNISDSVSIVCGRQTSLEEKYTPLFPCSSLEKRQDRQKYHYENKNIYFLKNYTRINREEAGSVAKC